MPHTFMWSIPVIYHCQMVCQLTDNDAKIMLWVVLIIFLTSHTRLHDDTTDQQNFFNSEMNYHHSSSKTFLFYISICFLSCYFATVIWDIRTLSVLTLHEFIYWLDASFKWYPVHPLLLGYLSTHGTSVRTNQYLNHLQNYGHSVYTISFFSLVSNIVFPLISFSFPLLYYPPNSYSIYYWTYASHLLFPSHPCVSPLQQSYLYA